MIRQILNLQRLQPAILLAAIIGSNSLHGFSCIEQTLAYVVSEAEVIVAGEVTVLEEIEIAETLSVRIYQRIEMDVYTSWGRETPPVIEFVGFYDVSQGYGKLLTTGQKIIIGLDNWISDAELWTSSDVWSSLELYSGPCDLFSPIAHTNWYWDLVGDLSGVAPSFHPSGVDGTGAFKLADNWSYRPGWGTLWTHYGDWQVSQYFGWYWMADYYSSEDIWIWSTELGWCWTASAFYPWMYRIDTNSWIWVRSDPTQLTLDGLCSVYDYGTNSWLEFTIGDFWWYLN